MRVQLDTDALDTRNLRSDLEQDATVAVAEIDRPVRKVIALDMVTMTIAAKIPTWPTTHPMRRYMMTPQIVRMLGMKTPLNVPNPLLSGSDWLSEDFVAELTRGAPRIMEPSGSDLQLLSYTPPL